MWSRHTPRPRYVTLCHASTCHILPVQRSSWRCAAVFSSSPGLMSDLFLSRATVLAEVCSCPTSGISRCDSRLPRPLEMFSLLARVFQSTSLIPLSLIATHDMQCFSQTDIPRECGPQLEDYLECLHHTKEVRHPSWKLFVQLIIAFIDCRKLAETPSFRKYNVSTRLALERGISRQKWQRRGFP